MEAFKVDDHAQVVSDENSLARLTLDEWTKTNKAALKDKFPVFAIDDDKPVDEIIRPPNADDSNFESVLQRANKGKSVVSCREVFWGKLVNQGEILEVMDNGQTNILGPGRWSVKFHSACFTSLGRTEKITQDNIKLGQTFSFVRVRRGKIGLAMENGKPVLLKEGLHVYNDPLFSFQSFADVDAEHINHLSYHVLRVPKGHFGKIVEQGRAKLLPEGTHAVDNPVFQFIGMVRASEAHINHLTVHIIQVPKGHLGLIFESNFPRLLHEGVHIYDSATLRFDGIKNLIEPQIIHGTISRFRVQMGEVGLAMCNNEPMLIEVPGTYQVDSASFRFIGMRKASDKRIELESKKIVTVYEGEVGVTFKRGTLEVLKPGRHYIQTAEHVFDDFLSTQQRNLRLEPEEPGPRGDRLLMCETKDLVQIGIIADVFFRIDKAEQVITRVGREFIETLVKETSVATLTNIIRSTALGEIAQSEQASAQSQAEHSKKMQAAQATGAATAPLFFDKAHDQFISKLHDDFMERYGIEITNIRIEQFKIMDDKLQASISGQAIKTAETQSQLANLAGQTQIETQQKERENRIQQMAAEAEAKRDQTKADSKKAQAEADSQAQQVKNEMAANTKKIEAQAAADALRTKAQGEADAVEIQAKADAEAIKLRAQAEGERAQLLASTPLGEKLSLLEVYGGMVKSSNEGVQKVVYVDPATTASGNPLGLLTLQSLTRDIAHLNGIEDAA